MFWTELCCLCRENFLCMVKQAGKLIFTAAQFAWYPAFNETPEWTHHFIRPILNVVRRILINLGHSRVIERKVNGKYKSDLTPARSFNQTSNWKKIIQFIHSRLHQSSLFHWIICAALRIKDILSTNTLEYASWKDLCLWTVLIESGASQL